MKSIYCVKLQNMFGKLLDAGKSIKTSLNIPDNRRITLLITLGYSVDVQREKKRKKFDEIVR